MSMDRWQQSAWLGRHRAMFARHRSEAVVPYVRALNRVALDQLSTGGPNLLFDEAQQALMGVIDDDGATPVRVHHLAMIYINDAQANAFSDGPWSPDLGRALAAAQAAVHWHVRLAAYAQAHATPVEAAEMAASSGVNAHLTLARVQAACALVDEAHATFETALQQITTPVLELAWRNVARSVGQEIGADPATYGCDLADADRTQLWYWYPPAS